MEYEDKIVINPQHSRLTARNVAIALVLVFILFSLFGGGYAWRVHKKIVQEQIEKKDSLQTQLDTRDVVYEERFKNGIDSVSKLNVKRNDYYNEMVYFKNRSEAFESELQNIDTRKYDTAYLDSLARHVKYK